MCSEWSVWVLAACMLTLAGCGGGTVDAGDCHSFSHSISQGDGQTAPAGKELSLRPSLQVTCTSAATPSLVEGMEVVWTVVTGDGTVNGNPRQATTVTSAGGIASVVWVLGSFVGQQEIRAEYRVGLTTGAAAAMASQTFVATATAPRACDVAGGTDYGSRTITTSEVWTAASSPHRGVAVEVRDGAVLTVQPGASVCFEQLTFTREGRLHARGTAAEPIVISGSSITNLWAGLSFNPGLAGTVPAAPSVLEHVVIENPLSVIVVHPVQMSDVTFRRTLLGAPGNAHLDINLTEVVPRLDRIVVESFGGPPDPQSGNSQPAVTLATTTDFPMLQPVFDVSIRIVNSPADGLLLRAAGNRVNFTACQFSGNGGNGIVAEADAGHITLTGCNLFDNALAGVRNNDNNLFHQVDASGNWWGDPAGNLPFGDGVVGWVSDAAPLSHPVVLGY